MFIVHPNIKHEKKKFHRICLFDYKQREEEVKSTYRSYTELKEDFADINMNIETDAEIVEKLVVKLGNYVAMDTGNHGDDDTNTLIATLTDLEYLLHQVPYIHCKISVTTCFHTKVSKTKDGSAA